ncbi:hypothetical protein [Thermosediminibacter oceani]|uniref:Uncharacterized protein n=1 Tax=Thermosediminibacter oceani (strain ATCC BAA-1034 / DSM 16646 / JW/IW-1228P) TaxID=555079 RepID=D9S1E3_THEOJ|nr:hypothetical protein [Thermosediminibacter oceani]ADL07220.1 hypothetical protein Toce_0443 [Thermosediminibacter oceani DSM 16646]
MNSLYSSLIAPMIQCDNRLAELKAAKYSWLDSEKIINYLKHCKESPLSDNPKAKRKIIETFVDKIIIHPDRIDTSLKINIKFETERGNLGGGEPCLTIPLSVEWKIIYSDNYV